VPIVHDGVAMARRGPLERRPGERVHVRQEEEHAHRLFRLVVMLQYVTPLAVILPEDDFRSGASFRHLLRPEADSVTALLLGAR
jgi:hypothetical protein